MLSAGVIEHGEGAWGFPVVLVRKKDGSVRFCVDYRALNSVTRKDVYPLPRIDETLESLEGARLFTTLDLRSGYWQIRVANEDRDKTAFMTKRGLYRFKRMLFGLTNAPATFQRLMNGVLRGLTWMTCLVYLDDIIIFTKGGIERHVIELAGVLERLRAAGLSLKLKKCTFATTSMEYLGHHLSDQGVQPAERLVRSVREFPWPTDATEVKRFVHLAGYYRTFIAAFGSIVEPMTRLLKKDVQWDWSEAQEFAFERVKMLLTTRPLLLYPNFELPFRLVTDASKVGLGACLMQDHGQGWQPIAYGSKVNNSAESNYSITELECLAVVWSIKLFRPYLYGRAFTIITDHAALKWLMTRPNLAGRLHRWSLVLQEYEFQVKYRPGSTNVVADALSRAPAVVRAAIGRQRQHQPATAATPVPSAAADATPMQANETGEATRTTTGELPQMLTSGEATQTAVPDAPTARGSAVCASSAAAEVTRAEDATSGLEVVPPAPGSAAPVPQTTGKSTDWVVTASDTVVEPSNDLAATANGTMAAQGDGLAVVATTDGAATVDDGLTVGTHEASDSIALAPIASRKRPKKAAEPATRRSVRIRERTERHVHWATAAPDAGQPAAPRTAPRAALDAIGMSPSAGRGTTTTTTTRATLPDVTSDVQDVSAAVEPRTMATETAGAPATTSTAPAAATPAPRASGASVPRPVAARSARREVTAPPTHREKTATMREAPVVSTEAVTKKRPTKGATKANTARETTATAGVAPTTQNVSNNAVVMTDGADDWGKDEEDAPVGDTLQLSDDELMVAQKRSKFVKRLLADGRYGSMKVETKFGLVTIETTNGWRVVLPPTLWSLVFKEMHGTVWSGHLRGPHTYGRVAQLYWWPGLYREVRRWIRGCPECGSRKAKPREVIPPLRSLRGGAVGDRWALDVAGPFPVADGGDRYVIAAVEYVTRYAVASCVKEHTAQTVATFIMQEVVLRFGVFRELLTDSAPELAGKVIEELVQLLQAHQINPVPYRPQMVGLVERFHRSWKDCVATFMQDERHADWNLWVKFAVYSYKSARHSTVALSPNELMMGRRLRAPNELLRRSEVTEAGELPAYHTDLLKAMERSHECAEQARRREQERQARYYNRKTRNRRQFQAGDLVWMHNPPRCKNATKFVHQWMGPLRVVEPAGYANFVLTRVDKTGKTETLIAHVSFLISYHYPEALLAQVARDIDEQLDEEDQRPTRNEPTATAAQWAALMSKASGVAAWWSAGGDDGGTAQVNTCWSTSCTPVATHAAGRLATDICGSTMNARDLGGRQWPSTNGCIETTGSWKTRGLRKACKEVGASPVNETAVTAKTTDGGVAVHGRVGRESSRPRNRQDRQHGKIQTSGSSDPTNAASSADSSSLTIWPANEQAGRLDQRALGSGRETNERRTNEVWLDATTDSVDDYTAVDDGGVMDREHLASESLDGCDE
ncbi:hypothetical protein PF011_g12270 [Phytophthora fragariae]|uniref:Reverse transcriptase n=5 Tax=Phytophthora fragariae TaxID=53985 RepID=A0A6A3KH75_9STRA|nr:hypothetical protein PF011_g12270 [Phytophthora fragariae]